MIESKFKRDPKEMAWIEGARCIGEDPELFFPVGITGPAIEQTELAKKICLVCPVVDACLEWSLKTAQDAGVWGAMGEEERREIRRARRRAAAAAAVSACPDDSFASMAG
ncbi:MAG: WhiB family transcriptional regulator, redox-sensing transcriptional regulator [Actinomycetota bacterium]|jgi:WhiB family redox-sensing transcriptional regulator|nr:WhiB family transcriptional regulator, redox-sensing transcriptional regulator [Actinomycetota bacterium]